MRTFCALVLYAFCLVFLTNIVVAQDLGLCGTPTHRSKWLRAYQQNPSAFLQKTGEELIMPMAVHRVGPTDDSQQMFETDVLTAMCILSQDMEGTDITIYFDGFRYIYDTDFFEHETVLQGADKMFEYNVDSVFNAYIVKDPASNCGYNLPYAGCAVAYQCAESTDHTWVHELGHGLSLPHPFLGWEGGVSHDNSEVHNFNNPAPEYVLYDYTYFKDTLILDTMIVDTSWVEKVDGSNCTFAADGFCDTQPDYIAGRWMCDENGKSVLEQTDPNGEKFHSYGKYFMSYSNDACAREFSPEQIAAMRANLLDKKAHILANAPEKIDPVTDVANYLLPESDEIVPYNKVDLEWESVENAEYYLVQLGIEPSNSVILHDTIVSTTSLTLYDLNPRAYYWRVKAYNGFDVCTPEWGDSRRFVAGDFSDVKDVGDKLTEVVLYPNPTDVDIVDIRVDDTNANVTYSVMDVNGVIVLKGNGTQIECHSLQRNAVYIVNVYNDDIHIGVERLLLY